MTYNLNRNLGLEWGPFGVLVRELAFEPDQVCNHDYLAIPETIEDIGRFLWQRYGYDIRTPYEERSRACIVKFRAPGIPRNAVSTAIEFLFCRWRGVAMDVACNYCYDGKGSAVPAGSILQIEHLPYIPPPSSRSRFADPPFPEDR